MNPGREKNTIAKRCPIKEQLEEGPEKPLEGKKTIQYVKTHWKVHVYLNRNPCQGGWYIRKQKGSREKRNTRKQHNYLQNWKLSEIYNIAPILNII
jgi:hypothetical protein